ncbi:MAG: GDP-mannose 4,6-dehydratase, partial [Ignavibacteriaceae bacterium]
VNPIGPRGVYDEAKRFAEALTMAYHRYHNVETRIARIFNTFGTRMRVKDGRAIPNFIMQALNSDPITVYGDGSQTRSFCYISDQVDGLFKLLMSDEDEPVNIGNPEEIPVVEIAREIISLTNSKSKIIFEDLPENDPKVRQPDISKAIRILGWKPKVKREDGLKYTIEYFKKLNQK